MRGGGLDRPKGNDDQSKQLEKEKQFGRGGVNSYKGFIKAIEYQKGETSQLSGEKTGDGQKTSSEPKISSLERLTKQQDKKGRKDQKNQKENFYKKLANVLKEFNDIRREINELEKNINVDGEKVISNDESKIKLANDYRKIYRKFKYIEERKKELRLDEEFKEGSKEFKEEFNKIGEEFNSMKDEIKRIGDTKYIKKCNEVEEKYIKIEEEKREEKHKRTESERLQNVEGRIGEIKKQWNNLKNKINNNIEKIRNNQNKLEDLKKKHTSNGKKYAHPKDDKKLYEETNEKLKKGIFKVADELKGIIAKQLKTIKEGAYFEEKRSELQSQLKNIDSELERTMANSALGEEWTTRHANLRELDSQEKFLAPSLQSEWVKKMMSDSFLTAEQNKSLEKLEKRFKDCLEGIVKGSNEQVKNTVTRQHMDDFEKIKKEYKDENGVSKIRALKK